MKLTDIKDDSWDWLKKIFNEYYVVQNFKEMEWLVDCVEKIIKSNLKEGKPSVIIEVGVEAGGTMKIWEKVLEKNGKGKENLLIGIDFSPNVVWDIRKSEIDVRMIVGNSHDDSTLEKVKEILFDGRLFNGDMMRSVDFVYIDGEHTSGAAMKDFEMYGGMVESGGAVGFHDVGDVRGFLNMLDQDSLEIFQGLPPFTDENRKNIGVNATIGTAFYSM